MMHMERVGRRMLICSAVTALLSLCWHSPAPAQQSGNATAPDKPDMSKQPGRYQIVMHPTYRADQYLLDTVTGQIWQLMTFSSLQGEPTAWKFMPRLDNQADYMNFIVSRPNKKPEGSSEPLAATAPGARAKPAAPMKLN